MSVYQIDKNRVGNFIRNVRGNLSMEEFAIRINVTKGTVNNYEKGKILPSKKVADRIIEKSDTPNLSINELLYGTPKEYLSKIFEDVPAILKDIELEGSLYQSLLQSMGKEINYRDEKHIVEYTYHLDNSLREDIAFLELWNDYSLDPFKIEIEDSEVFRTSILPIFNKYNKSIEEISKYEKLFETLLDGITTNEEMKVSKGKPAVPIRRKSPVILENYYSKEYITGLSELEKYELETKLEAFGASMYKFFDEFNEMFSFSIDTLFKDYQQEELAIKEYLVANNKNPDDLQNIREYKDIWWS